MSELRPWSGLRYDNSKKGRLNLVHDQVDWVATHRSGLESPLRHALFYTRLRAVIRQ